MIRKESQSKVDKSTEEWLSSIASRLEYKKWYFGHFHDNRDYPDAVMLFEEIREHWSSHRKLHMMWKDLIIGMKLKQCYISIYANHGCKV